MSEASPEVLEQWRKEFETARMQENPYHNIDRDEHGQYVEIHTWVAWKYWVKARQSVVIELPKKWPLTLNPYHNIGRNCGLDACREAIESKGYRAEVKQ